MQRSILATFSLVALAAAAACADPPPAKMTPNKPDPDAVAANSASEERLSSGTKPKSTTSAPADDPAQPLTTPVTAEAASPAAPAPATGKGGKPTKTPTAKEPKGAAGSGSKVSKAECKQLFDKYIDLTVGSDTRFEGIPPEMIAQLKASALSQAQSEKGDPCSTQEVSRQQYNCAIAAPTTAAWQRCMK